MEHDYCQILGVPPTADLNAIKKAFRGKVMEYHPDLSVLIEALDLACDNTVPSAALIGCPHGHTPPRQGVAEKFWRPRRSR